MSLCAKISLALICLVGLAQLQTSHAQNSQQDYLNAHNVARAQVRVPNITWDSTVATYAQNYANSRIGDCNLVHSNSRIGDCNLVHSNGSYGENLAKGSGSFTGTAAVNLWVAEKNCYDYNSNTCVFGDSACTIHKLYGEIQFVLGVLEFSAIMGGGLSLATMILQAIMLDNVLISEA
uniref:SCP domain-containing protein n=1 Tax=Quercus lobata TaxID=97700 RepID=A0A7N2MZW1_QUELO